MKTGILIIDDTTDGARKIVGDICTEKRPGSADGKSLADGSDILKIRFEKFTVCLQVDDVMAVITDGEEHG